MCGICGILNFKKEANDPGLVRNMIAAMAHRGPDAVNSFTEDGITLGHLRLSIIDLSSAANQPFEDNSGRYMLVFNGEIYNYNEVKRQIADYDFHTTSDTEVIVAAYSKWGPDCLQHFRGMFAFALWDRQEKELFLARDRMGVKPLYYFLDDKRLLFASEIRALLSTGLIPKKISNAALLEYFSYQSISYPYSPVEGVMQVEAGSWVKIRDVHMERKMFWDVTRPDMGHDFSDRKEVYKNIRGLMLQSIERRLVSDVPVGAFLSGGIDSSAVVGLMAEAGTGRPNTFTVGFEEKEFDESAYADMIARKFNTRHTNILLKPSSFLDELLNGLDAMDTPSGDGINTYVVSKAIRQNGMTVALSGAGGDELFAGYPFFDQYLKVRSGGLLWKLPAGMRRMAANMLLPGGRGGKKDRMVQLLSKKDGSIEELYPVFRQLLSATTLKRLTSITGAGGSKTAVQRQLEEHSGAISKLPLLSQVSVAEYLGYTQHTLLKDTDQMSMAVSLEVREPFFDQDLVEYVLAIPDDLKKPIYPKSLLVESLKPLLPDEIVHRKKQGFLFPWDHWLKNELRSFCGQQIDDIAERDFIHGDALKDYWRRFLAGDQGTRWSEIWLFVVLEYWLKKNM